jgi:hypothetical protein
MGSASNADNTTGIGDEGADPVHSASPPLARFALLAQSPSTRFAIAGFVSEDARHAIFSNASSSLISVTLLVVAHDPGLYHAPDTAPGNRPDAFPRVSPGF